MLIKSARIVSRELYWEKRVHIGLTLYGWLRVLRQYLLLCKTCLHAVNHRPVA